MAERLAGVDHDIEEKFNAISAKIFDATDPVADSLLKETANELILGLRKQAAAAAIAAKIEEANGTTAGAIIDRFRYQAIESYDRAADIEKLLGE